MVDSFTQGKIRGKFDEIIVRISFSFYSLLYRSIDLTLQYNVNEYAKYSFKAIVTFANRT